MTPVRPLPGVPASVWVIRTTELANRNGNEVHFEGGDWYEGVEVHQDGTILWYRDKKWMLGFEMTKFSIDCTQIHSVPPLRFSGVTVVMPPHR